MKTSRRRGAVGRTTRVVLLVVASLSTLIASRGVDDGPIMPFPEKLPSRSAGETYSFIAYGDVQGDNQGWHGPLVRQMEREDVDLIIHTGDISPDAGKSFDHHFLPAIAGLAECVAFFPSAGNHDVEFGSPVSREGFRRFFGKAYEWLARLPGNEHLREAHTQKLWYALVHGGVLFVALDSNLFIDEGKYASTHALSAYQGLAAEQMHWLRKTLERYQRDPSIRARFVYFHHSPFVTNPTERPLLLRMFLPFLRVGGHPDHDRMVIEYRVTDPQTREAISLLDLLRVHGVTGVFTGHEHYYERWREIIEEDGRPARRINWVVTGQGGARARGRPLADPRRIAERMEDTPTYTQYLARAGRLQKGWSARLEHRFPNPDAPEGLFPHYVLVTVRDGEVRFQTKDTSGRIRDEGVF